MLYADAMNFFKNHTKIEPKTMEQLKEAVDKALLKVSAEIVTEAFQVVQVHIFADLLEIAWGIIANATNQGPEWTSAAEAFRAKYHADLSVLRSPTESGSV